MTRHQNSSLDPELLARVTPGLKMLLEAKQYADDLGQNGWNFAVGIGDFYRRGMTEADVRWMICKGLAQHARELRVPENKRAFEPASELTFSHRSCFIVTHLGESISTNKPPVPASSQRRIEGVPFWDVVERKLWWESKLVKSFKHPALNQEIVLAAFERDGWPHFIPDPFGPAPEAEAKRRLMDTIKSLNRNHAERLIYFHGNGTGRTIAWERHEPNASRPRRKKP